MISSVLALSLASAAMQGNAINRARPAYSECLGAFVRTKAEARTPAPEFEAALATACAAEAAALRSALISTDVADGISRREAEQIADAELDDHKANALESFRVRTQ